MHLLSRENKKAVARRALKEHSGALGAKSCMAFSRLAPPIVVAYHKTLLDIPI